MPPKLKPSKQLKVWHNLFKAVVDGCFCGNLSQASRTLGMPYGTVQKYYSTGPRRLSHDVEMKLVAAAVWANQHEVTLAECDQIMQHVKELRRALMHTLYVECEHATMRTAR